MADWFRSWQKKRHTARQRFRKTVAAIPQRPSRNEVRLARQIHAEVFETVDCLECANCCRSLPALINQTDIRRLAGRLNLSEGRFEEQCTRRDEDGDRVLTGPPCPFIEESGSCTVYSDRPRSCQDYPHTDGDDFFRERSLHLLNAASCPAAFMFLEKWQTENS